METHFRSKEKATKLREIQVCIYSEANKLVKLLQAQFKSPENGENKQGPVWANARKRPRKCRGMRANLPCFSKQGTEECRTTEN